MSADQGRASGVGSAEAAAATSDDARDGLTAGRLLNDRFAPMQGGLFADVTKADVGDGVARLQDQGYRILSWADPWFPDPALAPGVRKVLQDSVDAPGTAHYTLPIGGLALREAVAQKCLRTNGLELDPRRHVLITPGSDSGLYFAMAAVLDAGDEVLVPDPSYPSNAVNCRLLGAVPVLVPMAASDGWQLDVEAMRAAITPRTRMVVLTHPNNPTGTVLRRDRLEALRDLIVEHDLVLVCDQAFEDFIYDDVEMVTPASLPGLWERTLTVFSLSKGHGLSGMRVGYVVGPDTMMDALYGSAVNVVGATNTIAQAAAVAALSDTADLDARWADFEARRHDVQRILGEVPGVRVERPESGFLSWIEVRDLGTGDEVAAHLLRDAQTSVNSGAPYGPSGEGHLRLVHGCYRDPAQMAQALEAVAASLTRLAAQKGVS
ncbi:pyridoxal phosphate-dependent aminotransferase [Ornithinimicrobium sufpigmenti]|uniref:pyridoxal phosphate-dependent aminotransferase n=1 Tax=Ornithinimicrobium sufpigmenti TaxID=2508882 RepID=UPI00192D85E5|nr:MULTISPECIES: pyridoxal phosphate-dependent aminotransferase [unclassified Ornithinimicrobium]